MQLYITHRARFIHRTSIWALEFVMNMKNEKKQKTTKTFIRFLERDLNPYSGHELKHCASAKTSVHIVVTKIFRALKFDRNKSWASGHGIYL